MIIFGQRPCNDLAKRSKSFLVLFFKKELLVFTYFFNFWTAWELPKKKFFLYLRLPPRAAGLACELFSHCQAQGQQYRAEEDAQGAEGDGAAEDAD